MDDKNIVYPYNKYYLVIKSMNYMIHVTTRVNPENIMLSERSWSQNDSTYKNAQNS